MVTIFLDVDGVLNSSDYFQKNYFWRRLLHLPLMERKMLDIKKVKLLSKLIKLTNAQVVMSSSWRVAMREYYYNTESRSDPHSSWVAWSYKVFEKYRIKFVGFTGREWKDEWSDKSSVQLYNEGILYGRGYEILTYIKEHSLTGHFLAIDDDIGDMRPLIENNNCLVTTWEEGMKKSHIDKAIELLKKGKTCEEWLAMDWENYRCGEQSKK